MRETARVMQYLVVLERTERNYGAHAPDLPGCVATGPTPEETLQLMHEAMEMHVRGIEQDGLPVPEPTSTASYISIAV
jgi:predicted RNase H-like HicB family nuclease